MPTFAIISPVLYEHLFINYFIQYHLNMGFNHIYILIDDINVKQDPYIIDNKCTSQVTFVNMTSIVNQEEINKNRSHHSDLVHYAIQKYYPNVNETYTILLGSDSFLYLGGLNIHVFFNINIDENENISQIFFRWLVIVNRKLFANVNLMSELSLDNLKQNKITLFDSNHFFTMGKKINVIEPCNNSHYYNVKGDTICWYNKSIFKLENSNNNFNYIAEKLYTHPDILVNGCILHFQLRDLNDMLIKTCFSWKKNNIEDIKNLLHNNVKEYANYKKRLLLCSKKFNWKSPLEEQFITYINNNSSLFPNIVTNKELVLLDKIQNNGLTMEMLNIVNIDINNYINWITKWQNEFSV